MQHVLWPRTFVLGTLIIVSLISFSFTAEATTETISPLTIADIISVTNTARTENGFAPLATSTLLTESAQIKANDMFTRGYFAHTSIDGVRFWTLISTVGYKFFHAGENLAVGYSTKEAVIGAWLNSPTHRANILSPKFKEIGIGLVHGTYQGREQWFVVQHFGSTVYYQ